MEALADRADTAAPVVSNLERGARNASRDMVGRLAAALAGPDPDEHTATALLNEGLRAAGFTSDGPEPPEDFDDWPPELRQALAHAKILPPETQKYIYKLWLEQTRAHADIEVRRQEAERKLEEREQRLRELSK